MWRSITNHFELVLKGHSSLRITKWGIDVARLRIRLLKNGIQM